MANTFDIYPPNIGFATSSMIKLMMISIKFWIRMVLFLRPLFL